MLTQCDEYAKKFTSVAETKKLAEGYEQFVTKAIASADNFNQKCKALGANVTQKAAARITTDRADYMIAVTKLKNSASRVAHSLDDLNRLLAQLGDSSECKKNIDQSLRVMTSGYPRKEVIVAINDCNK